MADKTFRVYDGNRYLDLEANKILIDNKETGHYKDINKVYITMNGILDSEEVQEDLEKIINQFHEDHSKSIYFLEEGSLAENYIFSSFSLNPEYSSLGKAIVKFIMNKNWILKSYEHDIMTKRDGENINVIKFVFDISNEGTNSYQKNINAYLYPMNEITFNAY